MFSQTSLVRDIHTFFLADDPDINLNAMGEVIGQDPSLSARMIKIANSAYMGRSVKVTSVSQAVTRIGLRQIKNISTALARGEIVESPLGHGGNGLNPYGRGRTTLPRTACRNLSQCAALRSPTR